MLVVRLGCVHLLLYNSSEFSRIIELMLILPDAAVNTARLLASLLLGTNEFTPQTCLGIHYGLSGVSEGRISPGKVAEEPFYVDGCH